MLAGARNRESDMRKLPAQRGPRVETGAIQIGDDWPGLFVRGDDCFGYALHLEQVIESYSTDREGDVIALAGVSGLLNLLRSTRSTAGNKPEKPPAGLGT